MNMLSEASRRQVGGKSEASRRQHVWKSIYSFTRRKKVSPSRRNVCYLFPSACCVCILFSCFCSVVENPKAKMIPKINDVTTISSHGICVLQNWRKVFLNMYETSAIRTWYSRITNMNIKPKNKIEKDRMAKPKFLNFIRGIWTSLPFLFSTFSIS